MQACMWSKEGRRCRVWSVAIAVVELFHVSFSFKLAGHKYGNSDNSATTGERFHFCKQLFRVVK